MSIKEESKMTRVKDHPPLNISVAIETEELNHKTAKCEQYLQFYSILFSNLHIELTDLTY